MLPPVVFAKLRPRAVALPNEKGPLLTDAAPGVFKISTQPHRRTEDFTEHHGAAQIVRAAEFVHQFAANG